MQFKTLLLAAGIALAAPEPQVGGGNIATYTHDPFTIRAGRSGSAIDGSTFRAAKSSISLNLARSFATCDAATDGSATFDLDNGKLYLYKKGKPTQELYVDRSGMGQGKIGYITGDQSPPKNSEMGKWGVTMDGRLVFNGAGFIACPTGTDKVHSVWVNAGVNNPGGNKNCFAISARPVLRKNPVGCTYTK